MIEQFLIPYVAGLNTAVGSRIFPGKAPDTVTKPYCVYYIVAVDTEHTHDSPAFRSYRFQFSVFSETYQTAASVRDAFLTALDGYKGILTAGAESLYVTSTLQGAPHFYEAETKLHHIAVDFEISHSL